MMKKYNLMAALMVALFCTQTAFTQVSPEESKSKKRAEKMRIIEEMNKPADVKGIEEKQGYLEQQQKNEDPSNQAGKQTQKNAQLKEDASKQKANSTELPKPTQKVGEELSPNRNAPQLNSTFTEKSKVVGENKKQFEAAPKDKQIEMLEKQIENAEGMTDEQKLALKIQIAEIQGQDVSEMKALQNELRSKELNQTTNTPLEQIGTKEHPAQVQSTQANGKEDVLVPALKGMSSTQKLEYLFRDTQFKKEVTGDPQWNSLSETDKAIFAEKMYFTKNQ